MRKRQVHIVAAQKNVIADGDTRELKIAVFLSDADERKIGCPSADIHDENDVSQFDLLAKTVSSLFQPRIKRRLRFFNQGDVFKTRDLGRLNRQLARCCIKACRNSQYHLAVIAIRTLESPADMFQVSRRCFDGRDLLHVGRRTPRQDLRRPVCTRIAQPAFRRRHKPYGSFHTVSPCELAGDDSIARVPWHGQSSVRKLAGLWQI